MCNNKNKHSGGVSYSACNAFILTWQRSVLSLYKAGKMEVLFIGKGLTFKRNAKKYCCVISRRLYSSVGG